MTDKTPKKRYSCTSEYATPKGSDDSDNSLYYSFVVSDDEGFKENSINVGGHTNSPLVGQKTKTPLLRKVLQANYTPRNKNNKRVSFNSAPKPNPTPESLGKVQKTNQTDCIEGCSAVTTSFNLKPIEECLFNASNKNVAENMAHNNENEYAVVNDSASDVTDDLENELHDTIIENTMNNTLLSGGDQVSECVEMPEREKCIDKILSSSKNSVTCGTKVVKKALSGASENLATRNAIKLNRQRLANESRKSVLPVPKKLTRATTYRSSSYEPRKMDARKSLGALKQAARKFQITTTVTATATATATAASTKPQGPNREKYEPRQLNTKPRLTMVNQPTKLPIVLTRKSILASSRAQLRETKSTFTKLALASSQVQLDLPSASSSNTSQQKFVKPKTVVVPNGNKCQYCDKFFAKNHGMTTHLLEKCEKIPASARRLLHCQQQQKVECSEESNSKHSKHQFGQEIDPISKYSRFFANVNGSSGMQAEDVENGLRNLRAELRKIKSAHIGITRTPSKAITCHLCKKSFLNCVEYADHTANHPPLN